MVVVTAGIVMMMIVVRRMRVLVALSMTHPLDDLRDAFPRRPRIGVWILPISHERAGMARHQRCRIRMQIQHGYEGRASPAQLFPDAPE